MQKRVYLIKQDSIVAWLEDEAVHVKAPYSAEFLDARKRIPGTSWNGSLKITTCNITNAADAIDFLHAIVGSYGLDVNVNELVPLLPKKTSYGFASIVENYLVVKTKSYDPMFNNELKRVTSPVKPVFNKPFDNKSWNVPIKQLDVGSMIEFIQRWNISMPDDLASQIDAKQHRLIAFKQERARLSKESSLAPDDGFACNVPTGLKLYPFQLLGVKYLIESDGRCLLADEMGLGKTVMVCTFLYNMPTRFPVLINVPNSSKLNWFKEVMKWIDLSRDDVCMISGKNMNGTDFIPPGKKVYIINHDIIEARKTELIEMDFKQFIIDESHKFKNYKAKRTVAMNDIVKWKPLVEMTGTPILNRPIELWTTIVRLGKTKDFGGNVKNYGLKYCAGHHNGYAMDYSGASNLDELQVKLREHIMLRRVKKDVLPELPKKNRMVVPLQIKNHVEYQRASKHFDAWYAERGREVDANAEAFQKIEALKQIAVDGKLDDMVDFIINAFENEGKIVVFVHHKKFLSEMVKRVNDAVKARVLMIVKGQTPEVRGEIIETFNTIKQAIMFCSLQVASESINLQTASTVIFTELLWTPGMHVQAEDRVHRIGQNKIVNIYYLIAEKTIENAIWSVIQEKQRVIDVSVDGMLEDEEPVGIIASVLEYIVNEREQ